MEIVLSLLFYTLINLNSLQVQAGTSCGEQAQLIECPGNEFINIVLASKSKANTECCSCLSTFNDITSEVQAACGLGVSKCTIKASQFHIGEKKCLSSGLFDTPKLAVSFKCTGNPCAAENGGCPVATQCKVIFNWNGVPIKSCVVLAGSIRNNRYSRDIPEPPTPNLNCGSKCRRNLDRAQKLGCKCEKNNGGTNGIMLRRGTRMGDPGSG